MDRAPGYFPTGRSRGVTVAVDGFFAFVWFGWGQANAPSWLVVPLAVGTGLAVLLTVAGVGVHFFPLAQVLENPSLYPLGVLLIAVALAALVTGLASAVAPSTITGAGEGRPGPGLACLR
jgi:hypothetical protein